MDRLDVAAWAGLIIGLVAYAAWIARGPRRYEVGPSASVIHIGT